MQQCTDPRANHEPYDGKNLTAREREEIGFIGLRWDRNTREELEGGEKLRSCPADIDGRVITRLRSRLPK